MKVLLSLVLIVLLAGGAYYFLFSKGDYKPLEKASQVIQQVNNSSPINDTDQAIDEDLTALDKDLAELNSLDTNFEADLKEYR